MKTLIANKPPSDNRDWDCQCARCGSSMYWDECWDCGGERYTHHDCGEDTCCCRYPEDNVACHTCDSMGGWHTCLSDPEWCKANPLPGREKVGRGTVEWFALPDAAKQETP